jgi:hypothetical protein
MWQKKFNTLSTALFIYGYNGENPQLSTTGVHDVALDTNAYIHIYGYEKITTAVNPPFVPQEINVPLCDLSKMFPFNAAAFSVQGPPTYVSNYQNRLDVAIQAKDEVQLEFYQDTDGTIVLKPQFYNMDTRQNKIYVIEDLDILNFNEIEDESQIITRVDATGTYVAGMPGGSAENANPVYGFAIAADKMAKYGLRVTVISNNSLTTSKEMTKYAEKELARRNALATNGSLSIQGRPELKLGYPIFMPSKNMFCYVTGIEHSFTFGGSFETTLSLTAFRKIRTDNLGNTLRNLLIQMDGDVSTQIDSQGKNFDYNLDDPLRNTTKLCDPNSVANSGAERPEYKYKTLDDLLQYQGTFKYIKDEKKITYDPRLYQQISDEEGYELIGHGYPFGRDLYLTEDFRIFTKTVSTQDPVEIISSMTIKSSNGVNTPTLSFQQPLTLDQVQNIEVVTASSSVADIILKMGPINAAANFVGPIQIK